jgi:hypothetical protein
MRDRHRSAISRPRPSQRCYDEFMILTVLKIVAGLAVLGIISMVLIAVISGLAGSFRALKSGKDRHDLPGGR